MLNAILADDEPVIIRGLRKLIPWEELGVRIVGEAWTGQGLMDLIEQEKPDLVITDISMPDGTGIDVIKWVNERKLRTKVIFVSAYQDFAYAKDAIAYGAVDYLVKPIEKDALLAAIGKAVHLVREQTEELGTKGRLAVYEQKDMSSQVEELFDRLARGEIRTEEAKRLLGKLKAELPFPCYTALELELEEHHSGSWEEHEKRLLLFAVTNLCEELVKEKDAVVVLGRTDGLCLIVNHAPGRDMFQLAEEMVEKIRCYLKTGVTVGVGGQASGLEGIRASYLAAREALQASYFDGTGRAHQWMPRRDPGASASGWSGGLKDSLLQSLLAKEEEGALEILGELFERIALDAGGSKEAAVASCYTLLFELVEGLQKVGIGAPASAQEQQGWLRTMQGYGRFEEVKRFVTGELRGMLSRLQAGSGAKEAQQMKLVKDYIEGNYQENITLESIASMVYMNPYYFSSFFKKHTGQNFKQYLTEVRMNRAVKLLLHTELMIYEIAEAVGYNNARQFSDMFKKQFGKLPHEYKSGRA
ncbi:two-component system response regulator YesN [Paenibacillus mucilaginosus]|uniref:response regulator n=1 Tax=Paenibacillus mucilaginosus TaxID=61624 RepID=UPI003D20CC2C